MLQEVASTGNLTPLLEIYTVEDEEATEFGTNAPTGAIKSIRGCPRTGVGVGMAMLVDDIGDCNMLTGMPMAVVDGCGKLALGDSCICMGTVPVDVKIWKNH